MMLNKTVGIIIAKKNSTRFPGKNIHEVDGYPLFYHNVCCLLSAGINDVYVATDSPCIQKYCYDKNIEIINRGVNLVNDDQTWFDVVKNCYFTLPKKYDVIVSILANCIGHNPLSVITGIQQFEDDHIKEVRSFDSNGKENGIIMLRESVLYDKHEISNYLACVTSNGKEIHYPEDLCLNQN